MTNVAPRTASSRSSSSGSRATDRSTRCTAPPLTSGSRISSWPKSKENGASASTESSGVKPNSSRAYRRMLAMPRWGSTAPLGVPVDPEV